MILITTLCPTPSTHPAAALSPTCLTLLSACSTDPSSLYNRPRGDGLLAQYGNCTACDRNRTLPCWYRDFDCVRLPMVICSKEQLAISNSVISISGNLNRNGNIQRNIGMRNRKYFENGNRIEIVRKIELGIERKFIFRMEIMRIFSVCRLMTQQEDVTECASYLRCVHS